MIRLLAQYCNWAYIILIPSIPQRRLAEFLFQPQLSTMALAPTVHTHKYEHFENLQLSAVACYTVLASLNKK
jgi:hypothetical protein